MIGLIDAIWQTATFGTGSVYVASFLFVPTLVALMLMFDVARWAVSTGSSESGVSDS